MVRPGLTPRQAVEQVEAQLAAVGCPDADFDAGELFRLATGRDPRLSEAPSRPNPCCHEFPVQSGVKGISASCDTFICGFLDGTEGNYIKAPRVIDREACTVSKNSP